MAASLTVVARRFGFVREVGGANVGAWVTWFQRHAGGQAGESWCADFESMLEDIAFGQHITPNTGSCQTKLDFARGKGWVVSAPAVDDLYFYVNDAGHAHHIGVVSQLDPLIGIAGNTSEDGASDNGTGVFEHEINAAHCVFVRLPQ